MTEQELKEKLAKYLWEVFSEGGESIEEYYDNAYDIIAYVKQAGYVRLAETDCVHNWVHKGKRRESRNYGSWDVDIYYCSKCLATCEK